METYVSVPERRRLLRGLRSSARKPGKGFHPIREKLGASGTMKMVLLDLGVFLGQSIGRMVEGFLRREIVAAG